MTHHSTQKMAALAQFKVLDELRQVLLQTAEDYRDTGLSVDTKESRISLQVETNISNYREAIIKILLETAEEYAEIGLQVDPKKGIIDYGDYRLKLEVSNNQIDLKITQFIETKFPIRPSLIRRTD